MFNTALIYCNSWWLALNLGPASSDGSCGQFQMGFPSWGSTGNRQFIENAQFLYKSSKYCTHLHSSFPNLNGTKLGLATSCEGSVDVLLGVSCASLPNRRLLSEQNEGTKQHNVQGSFKCWDSIRTQLKTPQRCPGMNEAIKGKVSKCDCLWSKVGEIWWNWQPFNRKQSRLILPGSFLASFILSNSEKNYMSNKYALSSG